MTKIFDQTKKRYLLNFEDSIGLNPFTVDIIKTRAVKAAFGKCKELPQRTRKPRNIYLKKQINNHFL